MSATPTGAVSTSAAASTSAATSTAVNFSIIGGVSDLKGLELGEESLNLGLQNANAIVDQVVARLQIDEDESTATATQHSTEISSANQANSTMKSQIQTLLTQFQALQIANTPNDGKIYGCGHGRGRGCGSGRGHGAGRGHQRNPPLTRDSILQMLIHVYT